MTKPRKSAAPNWANIEVVDVAEACRAATGKVAEEETGVETEAFMRNPWLVKE